MLKPRKLDSKSRIIVPSDILNIFEECEDEIIVWRKKLDLAEEHYSLVFQTKTAVLKKIKEIEDNYTERLKMEIAMSLISFELDKQNRLSPKIINKLFVKNGKMIKPNGNIYFVKGTFNVLVSVVREKTFKALMDL